MVLVAAMFHAGCAVGGNCCLPVCLAYLSTCPLSAGAGAAVGTCFAAVADAVVPDATTIAAAVVVPAADAVGTADAAVANNVVSICGVTVVLLLLLLLLLFVM